MKEYIATFYSHFGAVRFKRERTAEGITAKMMPVPRALSASCGTCVLFRADSPPARDLHGEVEQIVEIRDNQYLPVYHAEEAP